MGTNDLMESLFRTGDGVFAVDQAQRIIFWNQGAKALLGYGPEEVIGKQCSQVMQGADARGRVGCTPDCPIIHGARQGKLGCGRNIQVRAKDGGLRWLSLTHTFVGPFNDHSVSVVHIFRDITPEMEAKRLLDRLAGQLSSYGSLPAREPKGYGEDADLTEREKQVLALLTQGEGTTSIARKLLISSATARNHIQNILAKLGVHTRLEAVAYALRHHLTG